MQHLGLFTFFLLTTFLSYAQSLKKELTHQDKDSLKMALLENSASSYSLSLTLNSDDFTPLASFKPATPSSMEKIREEEKKLKGNTDDYKIYAEIGGIYKKLFKEEEAFAHYKKAFELLTQKMNEDPQDSLYVAFGGILLNVQDYNSAIPYYEKALEVNPDDTSAALMLPFCYIFLGDFETGKQKALMGLQRFPNEINTHIVYYTTLLYSYYYSGQDSLQASDATESIDLSFIQESIKKYPDRFDLKLLYEIAKEGSFLLKLYDKYSKEKRRFLLSSQDMEEMKKMEVFYKKSLKDKKISKDYDYILNKALGVLYVTMNKPEQGITYLKKSIELKKPEYSNFNSNAGESYDAVITAYMLSGDTLSAKKIAGQKVKLKPEIDPVLKNYISLTSFHLITKDYTSAKATAQEAMNLNKNDHNVLFSLATVYVFEEDLKSAEEMAMNLYDLNNTHTDTFVLLGVISMLKNDYRSAYHYLTRAKEIDPGSETAKDLLARYFN